MHPSMHLSGITWNHTRGHVPMVATAQRFEERHPAVRIVWERRSLQAFADAPLADLAQAYDLVVLDLPWAGSLARTGAVVPLDKHFPESALADAAANSVGSSHASYAAGGHQWAVAIDAATPVASWREDLLTRAGEAVPTTWDDLLALARRGLVAVPGIPLDSLMNLYMLWLGLGAEPFAKTSEVVRRPEGIRGLEMLRELLALCDPACRERNPIRTYEAMTTGEDLAYCPFAYGYTNYARRDFTDRPLRFGGLVLLGVRPLRSTLGGTGLAISRRCRDLPSALAYLEFVSSPVCQSGLYVAAGGQPAHRSAWTDPWVDALSGGALSATLPTLDDAWLRPTYDGYLAFQDRAGPLVHEYLYGGGDAGSVVTALNRLYREGQVDHV